MPKSDDLLKTIEAVHAAGLDENLWPSALATVTELIGGVGTTLEAADKRSMRLTDFWSHGIPSGAELEYADHYLPISPRTVLGFNHHAGDIGYDFMLLDDAAMDRDPYYSEFLNRADMRYFIAGTLSRTPEEFACFAVQRSPRQGHVGAREIALMRRLLPHLRQAFDVTRRLRGGAAAARVLERALDWLADGVALVARDGAVVYANDALQDMARGKDIAIKKGALAFGSPAARARFAAALAAVARLRNGDPGTAALHDFPAARSSTAPPYLVSLRPLARAAGDTETRGRAVAIVFVRDTLRQDAAGVRLLVEMFGLTPAEADLARALQSGLSVPQYARERAVSLNTIYTHLRRIKEKTQCSRMGELIRKLNDLQVPLRTG